ncbi:MAG: efflux RND transporter permease subunit [Deltaproteobacteria bacterium]|nr:efflux RND transporter permease subunit [Deltaproteobacteria bacterium]
MTSIPAIAIRRPVFAWMLMAALILFGTISFFRLGISQMPDVDFPVLTASVTWEGAAPSVIEAEIVDRLEDALVSIEGLRDMASTIRQGQASLTLEFQLNRDVDAALQEVQSAISRVKLPTDVDPPTITKSNPDDQPIIWLGVSSGRTLHDLISFVDLNVKDQFQILPGVGEVILGGFTERNLRVWVDNDKLKQYELTILDVRDAIQRGHIETAAGRIENSKQELNLRVMGEGGTPEEVADILITSRGGKPIFQTSLRVKDIASVEDGLADIRRISRVNGTPGIGLGIKKQRGSNAVEVGNLVKQRMLELQKTLPPDVKIGVNFDSTVFIKESVEETEFTLLLSAIATGIVCWLFLGSLRPTFNVLLSIPTSIVGSFAVIYFMGFTLNFFTILGLALAIGIVVDDAIMVLENIYRHAAMGKDRIRASLEGAEEITFAAVAASIAVIAIFLPVAFMQGIIGKFFFQFGVTISAAVALSLLEAITLTPMRCSQFLDDSNTQGRFERFLNSLFERVARVYQLLLGISLRFRWIVLLVAVAIFASSLGLMGKLRKEFIPAQDQSVFIMRAQTPVGSSLEHTSEVLREVETYLMKRPDVARVYVAVGGFGGGDVNTGMVFISLKPIKERSQTQSQIMNEIRTAMGSIPDLKVFLQDLSTRGFTAQRGFPVEFNIRGAEWDVLDKATKQIIEKLSATGLVVDVDTDYRLGQPEIRVWPLRDEAAKRGVPVATISDTVGFAIGGTKQGKVTKDGRRYDVRVGLKPSEKVSADDITTLDVRNIHGEVIPIKEVIRTETVPTLQTITRRNRERSISVFANVGPGKSQAEAVEAAKKIGEEVLPPGYRVFLGGSAQTFIESFQSLYFVLWMGLVVAYMVLASQFNSFIHPVTVLLALPFSITGALYALYLSNQSLNLYSMIGIILLMGIVKKNSILLVEFINHRRESGTMSIDQAILEASPVRLRPILMTSFATLAAAIPPAMAIGPGAESRIPMSITIIGGVLVSTLFTLFVVPCAYRVFSRFESKRTVNPAHASKEPLHVVKSATGSDTRLG